MKKKKAVTIYAMVFVILVLALFLAIREFHIFADVIGPQYDLFAKSPLEPVYADTVPSSLEIIKSGGQIESFAAQGETEPVTFSVRPYIDLGSAQIDITDLTSGGNKIAKENIDLRNVKIWQQCGPKDPPSGDWLKSCDNPDKTMVYNVPELLVKDNEQDLQAEEVGLVKADKKYYAPIANNDFRADLKKDITHTFYLSIKAPKDAVAGHYTGTVTFKPQNASQQQFTLKLDVLPFELPESGKEIILHLTQRLADGADWGFADIGREKYEQYLDLVREAGVTSINLLFTDSGSSSTDNLNWLVGKIKEKGFHGTLIWRGSSLDQSAKIRQNLAILQGKGFDVYVYGKDEPNTTAKMLEGLKFSKQIHDAGGKVTTSVKKQCSEDLLDPNCPVYGLSGVTPIEKIDLPIYMIATSSFDCDFYNSWDVAISYKKLAPWLWIDGSLARASTAAPGIFSSGWHRVTMTWDAQSGSFKTYTKYPDGTADATTEVSKIGAQLPSNLESLVIGAADKKATSPYLGTIDNLKVYNRALTLEEFDTAGSSNLVASYNFNEGSGNTVSDQVSGKSCQIHGAGWTTGRDGSALSFDGTDDYVNCPGGTDLGISNAITVDAWIKVASGAGNDRRTIVSKTSRPDNRQFVSQYITGLQNGTIAKNPYKEFYYFQIWPEQYEQVYWTKPSYIRTMTGFFLYKSGLDGTVPYGLDSVWSTHGNKEYDDFDAALKDFRAVYRTEKGFLKTLQFETFREGIDDMRYMTKFDNVLAELRLKDSAKADQIKSAVNDKLKVYAYAGVGGIDPLVVTNAVNQANRKFVADKIVEIMAILEPTVPIPITAKGFSVFGNNKIVGGNVFASAGLYLYKFDGANNKWVVYPGSSLFNTSPFSGYYIYNPSSEDKTLSIPYDSTTISAYKVTSGWNMLWSASAKTRSQLRLEIAGQIKSVDEWVSQGKVYQNVFIIDNEKATSGCKYFKLLSTTNSAANCAGSNQNIGSASQIPANKAFWVYVYNVN